MKRKVYIGPPGTGKTEQLIMDVEAELGNGTDPRRIAFIGFTRQAAYGARDRAAEKFDLRTKDLPWFRTVHSAAFRRHGLTRAQVLDRKDLMEIGKIVGSNLVSGSGDDAEQVDPGLQVHEYARNTKRSLREAWEELGKEVTWHEVERLAETFKSYKQARSKLDFSDMLEAEVEPFPIEVLFLDEAQDFTTLQWDFIDRGFGKAARCYVAGDDDQCLFKWSGADVARFQSLDGTRFVLPQSHRVPRTVQEVAERVVRRISTRIDKTWKPTDREGQVKYIGSPDMTDMSSGNWLIMARNHSLLRGVEEMIRSAGYAYRYGPRFSVDDGQVQAIRAYATLQRGKVLSSDSAAPLARLLGRALPGGGADVQAHDLKIGSAPWHDALTGIPLETREYYLSVLRRDSKALTEEPRIRIETIHGAKGSQADNVLLLTDLAPRTYDGYLRDPDAEHRTFYVGITRARSNLYVCEAQTPKSYDI